MRFKKISFKNKVLAYFLITVFFVLLFVSLLIYCNVSSLIEAEMATNSNNTIVQLKNATDIIFKQADMSLMQVAFDYNIENLSLRLLENGYQDIKYDLKRISNLLGSNFYFSSAWVYYYDINSVADVSLVNPSIIDMDSSQRYKHKEYIKKVIECSEKDNSNTIFNFYNIRLHDQNFLTLVKPISAYSKKPNAILIVELNPSFFNDAMNSIKIDEYSDVFIIDNNGDVISKTNNSNYHFVDLLKQQNQENFHNKTNGLFWATINKENYMVTYDTSPLLGWKYIYVMPEIIIKNKISFIRKAVFLIFFLCAFFGIFISLLFTKKVYNPIDQIKKNIVNFTLDAPAPKDDIEYIHQNVNNLINENKSLEKSFEENIPIIKNSILINLLKDRTVIDEQIWNKFNFYNIQLLKQGLYCVCLISIDQYEKFAADYDERQRNLLETYLKNTIRSICQTTKNVVCEVVNFDINQIALILSTLPKEKHRITDLINTIHTEIQLNMPFTITIGVGGINDTINNIPLSYRQATTAQNYKVIHGNNTVISIHNIPKQNNWEYIYRYDIEKKISHSLKQGNETELMQTLNTYFEYAKKNMNAATNIKYAFIRLLEITIETCMELAINVHDFSVSEAGLHAHLLQQETIYDAHVWFEKLYKDILDYMNSKRDKKDDLIALKIKDYIDDNFTCPEINLDQIADSMYFSISYLSRVFKDTTNMSIKEYITAKRMEHAKELLEESNMKIKEISKSVGYTSDRSFINMFKKLTGETPGKYRERLLKII